MENQIAILGKKYYDEHLKQILEPEHNGEFVTIDYESGQYFIGKTDGEALHRGKQALPDKILFLARIGFNAVQKMGGFYGARKRKG
jgi:hypothetical protein